MITSLYQHLVFRSQQEYEAVVAGIHKYKTLIWEKENGKKAEGVSKALCL